MQEIRPVTGELARVVEQADVATTVSKGTDAHVEKAIDIPFITVVLVGEITAGCENFDLIATASIIRQQQRRS